MRTPTTVIYYIILYLFMSDGNMADDGDDDVPVSATMVSSALNGMDL